MHHRVENLVVDAASIEVNSRNRRAKSDNLDATKLVAVVIRWQLGEKKLWGIVRVPMAADEDRRQLHRELIELNSVPKFDRRGRRRARSRRSQRLKVERSID